MIEGIKNNILEGTSASFVEGTQNNILRGTEANLMEGTKEHILRGTNGNILAGTVGGFVLPTMKNPPQQYLKYENECFEQDEKE